MVSQGIEKGKDDVTLPPDGKLIYVSQWRKQLDWVIFGWFALVELSVTGTVLAKGGLTGFLFGIAGVVLAGISLRVPMTGVMLEAQGLTLRTTLWTYHWGWNEIDHFELKRRGYIPRLRVHLRSGSVKKAPGFFARKPADEERCQALFVALEERLEREQASGAQL